MTPFWPFQSFVAERRRRKKIKLWKNALNLNVHAFNHHQLFANNDGFKCSQEAKALHPAWDYTYGEIDFFGFIALLSLVKPDKNTIFYDLGSGVGTAVLAAAMVFPLKKSIGIELFPALYDKALQQKNKLCDNELYHNKKNIIVFKQGNFLTTSFDDATLIFINSTAFFGETWIKLNNLFHQAPQLQTIITTSKTLISPYFEPIHETYVAMSWGIVRATIHQRKNFK